MVAVGAASYSSAAFGESRTFTVGGGCGRGHLVLTLGTRLEWHTASVGGGRCGDTFVFVCQTNGQRRTGSVTGRGRCEGFKFIGGAFG